jgi:hypothetical protein
VPVAPRGRLLRPVAGTVGLAAMPARAEFAVGVEPAALAVRAPPPAFVVDPLPGVPELGVPGVAIGGIGGVDGTSTAGGDGSPTSGIAGTGTARTGTSGSSADSTARSAGAASVASEPAAWLGVAATPTEGSDAKELVGAAKPRPSANWDASPIRALFGDTRMHTPIPALRHGAVRA